MQGEKWIVPAMNSVMFGSPAVQRNLKTLSEWGVKIIEPECGHLACGEEGKGKFPEPADIADFLEFSGQSANAKTLLITIGRTEEAIDPVRYISNRSSGKTGAAIAKEFLRNGWRVIAVCGPMEAELPKQCETVCVKSASDMNKVVLEMQQKASAIAHCAAVADYSPKTAQAQKIKNSRAEQSLELKENPNILKNTVENKKPGQKIAAFALETENAIENAKKKFESNGADVLVVNTPASGKGGFGEDSVEFGIVCKGAINRALTYGSKDELAAQLFTSLNV
jgi:phosphopantothenoylcysteine decarboxylase/phosphopantothenate--cysteine ligase